jgi:hypothetical protein
MQYGTDDSLYLTWRGGGGCCNVKEEGLLLSKEEGLSLGVGKGRQRQSWEYNNQQRLEGWEMVGRREADAIVMVIVALEAEAAETMQRACHRPWYIGGKISR